MTFKTAAGHYLRGMGSSAWNAGINAVYATVTQGAGAGLVEITSKVSSSDSLHQIASQTLPTDREALLLFTGAAVVEIIRFLKDHPLPVELPPADQAALDLADRLPSATAAAASKPAGTPAPASSSSPPGAAPDPAAGPKS